MSGETIDNPAKFADAISSSRVVPGDTLLLKPGTYTGDWIVNVSGMPSAPITIQPITKGTVVIDGSIQTNLPYVTIRDIEIKYSGWVNRISDANPDKPGVILNAQGCKLINCYVHDVFQGVSAFESSPNAIVYGNVIQNVGWDSVKGRGHAIYLQNIGGTKLIKRNIIHPGYSNYGIHAYWEEGHLYNGQFVENVHQGCIFLIGGGSGATGALVDSNHIRGSYGYFGYTNLNNVDLVCTDNYFTGTEHSPWVSGWASVTVTGNKVYSDFASENPRILRVAGDTVVWNNNDYKLSAALPFYDENNGSPLSFADWKTMMGLDADSTFSTDLPTTNEVVLIDNEYDAGRMTVIIYNWEGLESVAVTLTGLANGDYRAHNTQNYSADYFDFTLAGEAVNFPMTGHSVAVPTQDTAARTETTFPAFGCFVVETK